MALNTILGNLRIMSMHQSWLQSSIGRTLEQQDTSEQPSSNPSHSDTQCQDVTVLKVGWMLEDTHFPLFHCTSLHIVGPHTPLCIPKPSYASCVAAHSHPQSPTVTYSALPTSSLCCPCSPPVDLTVFSV